MSLRLLRTRVGVTAVVGLLVVASCGTGTIVPGQPGEQVKLRNLLPSCTIASVRSGAPGNARPILERALDWIERGDVMYCQCVTQASSPYRADCSGFVSMAWGLGPPGHTTSTLMEVADEIDDDELQPGDALLNEGHHVILFGGWLNSSHTTFCALEEYTSGTPATIRPHSRGSYTPIRLRGYSPGAPTPGSGSGGCQGVTFEGECQGNTLRWCENGTLMTSDCAQSGQVCTLGSADIGYDCDWPDPDPDPDPASDSTGGSDSCGGVTSQGECQGAVLRYCDSGRIVAVDCGQDGGSCEWVSNALGYDCLEGDGSGGSDSGGTADPCVGLSYEGECQGDTLRYCNGTGVVTIDCAVDGDVCGWESSDVGYNCMVDPGSGGSCGDGYCDYDEDCDSCPYDCGSCDGPTCGDGYCDYDEDCDSCPYDCGYCDGPTCGDGYCDYDEDYYSCPYDCDEYYGFSIERRRAGGVSRR